MLRIKYIIAIFFACLCVVAVSCTSIFKTAKIKKVAEQPKQIEEIEVSQDKDGTLELVEEYKKNGEFDKAIEILQQAIKSKKRPWPELVVLGEVYLQKKEYALAEEAIEKAMEIEPNPNSHIYRVYGSLFLAKKNYSKAEEYFKNALKFADSKFKQADAYFHLAKLDYEQKRIDSAKKYMKKAVEISPDNFYFNKFLKELEKEYEKSGLK